MNEPAEAFASLDLAGRIRADDVEAMRGCGWFQFERAMRPVRVVVVDVDAQDTLKLSTARDQEPVETVAADRAHPALGDRVGKSRRLRSMSSLRSELFG